ncbi:MAG TPA: 3'-5' exonuclease [Solirubrobacterales bacterium]|nr:3'-5' exonuclease [Solirubrobacterales bacterium]
MPLPEPVGKQREVVCLDHLGHTVVLGTAGSGKTTMAVHRAAYLSNPKTDHAGPTLLLSFNNSLLAYLNYLCPSDLQQVDLRTYHRFARGYLSHRGKMGRNWICDRQRIRERLINDALLEVRGEDPRSAFLKRSLQFFVAEIKWMSQQGVLTAEEYLGADRVGRGDEGQLGARQREAMFRVFARYRKLRAAASYRYDWDDIASAVLSELADDEEPKKYKHIVIDEGQDFSPVMLRSLAAAIPSDGSLTFFGDVAQQVYGRRVSWQQAGLEITAPWRFERNYRNSPQIADVGLAIADMPYFAGQADMVSPTEFAAEGPLPTLVSCDSREEEVKFAIEQAKEASAAASVAILVRRHEEEGPFKKAFRRNGRRLDRDMRNWSPDPGISYGTVHNAKGYEFDTVILVGICDDRWPDPAAVEAEGPVEAEASDGRLLYVGVTRARSALILTYSGRASRLLPSRSELWTKVDLTTTTTSVR